MKTEKLILCIVFALIFAGVFSACEKNEQETTDRYVYTPADATTAESGTVTEGEDTDINIDDSWKSNYTAKYSYYNSGSNTEKITVVEKKSKNLFSAEDTGTGDILYYKYNGENIDSYVIVTDEEEQVHSVIKDKTLDDLSSTFMKLSSVDSDLPSLSNVLFMYEDSVGGRSCNKYIQRAYSEGKLTETVYVWIDSEYGFASKGEVYDENTVLTASWELIEFTAGGNEDSDVEIDLSGYEFKEN